MQDPGNKYPAFLAYYGPDDWFMLYFMTTQEQYKARLDEQGHFAVICDGEDPSGDIYLSAWQFLKDHPFGVDPEPYADGLPQIFPDSCSY
jgi:hypothetical protein